MKALTLLYPGFTEYAIPFLALHHNRIPTEVVGENSNHPTGTIGLQACVKKTISEIQSAEYDAPIMPGIDREPCPRLLDHTLLMDLIRQFDGRFKLLAAVCDAPVLLGAAGVLQGRRLCSERSSEPAVRDGHGITGLGARIFHFGTLLGEAASGSENGTTYRTRTGYQQHILSNPRRQHV